MSAVQLSDFENKFRNPSDVLHDALTGSFVEASKKLPFRASWRTSEGFLNLSSKSDSWTALIVIINQKMYLLQH